MQFMTGNPQDYISFPPIYKYYKASSSHSITAFTKPASEQLLT